MSVVLPKGSRLAFGVKERVLWGLGWPEGRKRYKVRNNAFAVVCVKTANGFEAWVPYEIDGQWVPGLKLAENWRGAKGGERKRVLPS